VDPFALGGQAGVDEAHWLEGTLDAANALGIPIMSALEWLHFTETRHSANLVNVQWLPDRGRLSFELAAQEVPELELGVMIPLQHGDTELTQIEVDGLSVRHNTRKVAGVAYGWIPAKAGLHQVIVTYT
jgi:hypothetical protein